VSMSMWFSLNVDEYRSNPNSCKMVSTSCVESEVVNSQERPFSTLRRIMYVVLGLNSSFGETKLIFFVRIESIEDPF